MRLHGGLRTTIHGGHMNDSGFFSWKNGFSVSLNSVAGVAQSSDVLGLQCCGRRRGCPKIEGTRKKEREEEKDLNALVDSRASILLVGDIRLTALLGAESRF